MLTSGHPVYDFCSFSQRFPSWKIVDIKGTEVVESLDSSRKAIVVDVDSQLYVHLHGYG